MAKPTGTVTIDLHRCKGCGLCIAACPTRTLGLSTSLNPRGYNYATMLDGNCTGCSACAMVCPDAGITVYRERRVKAAGGIHG